MNAAAKVSGRDPTRLTTVTFSDGQVVVNGTVVPLPATEIVFDPDATEATVVFEGGRWRERIPASYTGEVFLGGTAYHVSTTLPGNIKRAEWSGSFGASAPGLKVQWSWGAAVYTQFATNSSSLGVKPVDGTKLSVYRNGDHAGTPEAYKPYVIGGGTGGGGSNWTGGTSATVTVSPG